MKRQKVKLLLAMLVLFLGVGSLTSSVNAASISKVATDTLLDTDYSFTFGFIDGVTTTQVSSAMSNNPIDSSVVSGVNLNNYYSARLVGDYSANDMKGKVWIRYNNVGTYNGQVIDLKITLRDWDYLQPANTSANNYPTVFFAKDKIGGYISSNPAVAEAMFKGEFFLNGTDQPVLVRGYQTFTGIENGQVLSPFTGFDYMYLESGSHLLYDQSKAYAQVNDNVEAAAPKTHWATGVINGSSFEFKYHRLQDVYGNTTYKDIRETAGTTKEVYAWEMTNKNLAPFVYTTPEKVADKTQISGTDSVKYTVTQNIPYEYAEFYYDGYVFKDEIADCFAIKSVKVKDSKNVDRTSWFNVQIDGSVITATATNNAVKESAFYDNTLIFEIDVQKKEGYDIQPWMKGKKCVIPNKATVTINSQDSMYHPRTETLESNAANVECTFDIVTNITNGTITQTRLKQPAGSNQSVTFAPANGYYITSIVVDGVQQDLASYNVLGTNTYTFKNVSVDHQISVVCSSRKVNFIVNKTDAKTMATTQGDATFKDAVYGVYTDENCTNQVTTVTLDEKGKGTSNNEVAISRNEGGNYSYYEDFYIKEITAPVGYNLNPQVNHLTLDVTNLTSILTTLTSNTNDTIISNSIELTKYLEATDSVLKKELEGAMFTATLDSDPTKSYSAITDATGKAVIKDLPYGTYTIVEQTIPSLAFDGQFYMGGNNSRLKKFSVFIQEDSNARGPYTYTDITNVAKKMQITVYLLDAETGTTTQGDAVLTGAQYSIFTDEECTQKVQTITIAKDENGVYSATTGWYLVGTYYVKQTKAPTGYLLDEQVYTVAQNPEEQMEEYTKHSITSNDYVKRNNIEITKNVDETDSTEKQPLSGAVFTATLRSNTNTYGVSTETDKDGKCVIENLPYGTYTIRETTTPPTAYNAEFMVNGGARTNTFTQFVELDSSEADSYKFEDVNDVPKKMNITVYLEDAETGTTTQGDAVLEDAEYTLYSDVSCDEDYAIETLTIAKSGSEYKATSGWYLVGTYYVKQTKAPTGYLIDENIYTVAQVPSDQTTEYKSFDVTSKDYVKRNDIEITKNIESTVTSKKEPLSGAVFTASLDSKTSTKFVSNQTNEEGKCVIEAVPYGTYTITETEVPPTAFNGEFTVDGGERTNKFSQFVEEDKTEREAYKFNDVTDIAKKMQITIFAEDNETGRKTQGDATLEGAEYTLYSDPELTNEIETVTIAKNDDGSWSATSDWYLVGTYWLQQTKAPEGYLIDENVYKVEQDPAAQTVEKSSHSVTSKDKVKEGIIRVMKYSNNQDVEDKIPATGAHVRLTLNSDTSVYYDAIIDENGYAEFVDTIDETHSSSTETHCAETCYPYTIPYGTYSISEEAISDQGENIFIYKQTAEIREQDQVSRFILDEEYVRMRLTVNKTDVESGDVLAGAKFKIWNASKQEWYTERVYGSGEITDEFTVNNAGYFTIKGFLEAGTYVIYETKAPYGYYLDENMVEGSKGYELTVGVNKVSQVIVVHDDEETVLHKIDEVYEGIPVRIYPHSITVTNLPQKAVITVTDIASQFTNVKTESGEYGNINTPEYQDRGLLSAEFDIIAKEDIVTEYGTVKYNAGDVVEHITTDAEGKASTSELYLGKYQVVQTKVPNGYVLDSEPRELDITYTSQDVKVQEIPVNYNNKKQSENIKFEKLFDRIYDEIFITDKWHSVFGIYSAETIKNYRGQNTLDKDELIEVIDTLPNHIITNSVDLPAGKYYLKEIETTNPYEVSQTKYPFTIEFTTTEDENYEIQINGGKINNTTGVVSLEMLIYPEDAYNYYNINTETETSRLEQLASNYGIKDRTYGFFHDKECTDPVLYMDGTQTMFETEDTGKIYIEKMPTGTYYMAKVNPTTGKKQGAKVFKIQLDTSKTMYVNKLVEESLKGDMNVDGFVNSTDAALVLDRFKNDDATDMDYLRGDMDDNNLLNSTDAAMILDIFKNS